MCHSEWVEQYNNNNNSSVIILSVDLKLQGTSYLNIMKGIESFKGNSQNQHDIWLHETNKNWSFS